MAGKKKENPTCSMIVGEIPLGLRQEFKAACAYSGDSMKTVLIDFMRRYIDEREEIRRM